MTADQFRTPEQEAEQERAYQDLLVDRYTRNLPLTKTDRAEARRIIAERAKAGAA